MIDVLNETEHDVDGTELVACARYVMARMNVHPQAELCIRLVDEAGAQRRVGDVLTARGVSCA